MRRPKIVCICGSTRFKDAWEQANKKETFDGNIVLTVGCFGHADEEPLTRLDKAKLDVLHLHKVALADEILVLNVGGYIGESTEREIEHAITLGKMVRWLDIDRIPDVYAGQCDPFLNSFRGRSVGE